MTSAEHAWKSFKTKTQKNAQFISLIDIWSAYVTQVWKQCIAMLCGKNVGMNLTVYTCMENAWRKHFKGQFISHMMIYLNYHLMLQVNVRISRKIWSSMKLLITRKILVTAFHVLILLFLDGETFTILSLNYPTMKSALGDQKGNAMKLTTNRCGWTRRIYLPIWHYVMKKSITPLSKLATGLDLHQQRHQTALGSTLLRLNQLGIWEVVLQVWTSMAAPIHYLEVAIMKHQVRWFATCFLWMFEPRMSEVSSLTNYYV